MRGPLKDERMPRLRGVQHRRAEAASAQPTQGTLLRLVPSTTPTSASSAAPNTRPDAASRLTSEGALAGAVAKDGQGRIDAAVIIGLTIAAARAGNGNSLPGVLSNALEDATAKGCGAAAMVRDWIDRRRSSVRVPDRSAGSRLMEADHD